jgi:hypothetical protein
MARFKIWVASPFDADWPLQEPITVADLVTEARAVDWNFNTWCYASGYDANDPTDRRMFECLLAYATGRGTAVRCRSRSLSVASRLDLDAAVEDHFALILVIVRGRSRRAL